MTTNDTKGFWEWVKWYENWSKGCKYGCKYCYQMLKECYRFKRMTYEDWVDFQPNYDILEQKIEKQEGWGMLPSTHNIFPEILDLSLRYLKKHLAAGNKLLIVSKPDPRIFAKILPELIEYRDTDQIEFRYTITTLDDKTRKFWEPNAPKIHERFNALRQTLSLGYKASVSIEPFLDFNPVNLIEYLYNNFEDLSSIWLGRMTKLSFLKHLVPESSKEFKFVETIVSEANLISIVREINQLKPELQGLIRYKDTFKRARRFAQNRTIDQFFEVAN